MKRKLKLSSGQAGRVVLMTKRLAGRIKTIRLDVDTDGFQRDEIPGKVTDVVRSVSMGCVMPPIIVFLVNGVLYCVDGQHRLAAWKSLNYPLWAVIFRGSMEQAWKTFVDINGKSNRCGLLHRISIDSEPYAVGVRKLASDYSTSIRVVHNLLDGLKPGQGGRYPEVDKKDWSLAVTVLDAWTDDTRWGKKGFFFSKPGVLKLVGHCLRKVKLPAMEVITRIRTGVDYTVGSGLHNHYGAAGSSQNRMRMMVGNALGWNLGKTPAGIK